MRRWPAFALVLALAGCGGNNEQSAQTTTQASRPTLRVLWPAPANPMQLTRKAGLAPETHEFVNYHVHAHLDVFLNGRAVAVPAAIGIEIDDPAVNRFVADDGSTGYGGINPPCATPCISPLHTHFIDGILHTESKQNRPNTLGEFFVEWDVRLDRHCVGDYCQPQTPVAVYVDGDEYGGDPREIELEDRREIAIVIGEPPEEIPSTYAWG